MIVVVVIMMRLKIIVITVINDNQIYRVYEQHTHTPYFSKYKQSSPLTIIIFLESAECFFFYVLLTVHLNTSV